MLPSFEELKKNTTCPECKGTNITLGYTFGEGGIHKKLNVLGMDAYRQVTHTTMLVCKTCGYVIKAFAVEPEKLP